MRKIILSALLVLCLAAAAGAGEPVLVSWPQPAKHTASELLVKFRPGSKSLALLPADQVITALGVARLPIPAGSNRKTAAADWQQNTEVAWVQANHWRYAQAVEVVPNDHYYLPQSNQRHFQQWHQSRINANYAWSVEKGSEQIIVAVVDSGVDLNHPDLKGRLLPGATLVNQTGYTLPSLDGMDDNGHGTHISGLVAAQTNNNRGVAGCSWGAKILPVKVLNADGAGTDADIAAGIVWAADHGARIINLSLGGPSDDGTIPQTLQDAVNYAWSHGCLIVAAAGNSGDHTVMYPAALTHVLAVAATDPFDRRASYSTIGTFVALAAPGGSGPEAFTKDTGILSTFWDTNSRITDAMDDPEAGEYAIAIGTSMSSGIVSGAAQVLWSHAPSWTADQVASRLEATAVDIGAPGTDPETGAGRIDLLAALGNFSAERPDLTLYNFPNPFNPERDGGTKIVFLLDQPTAVTLSIYDASRDLVWRRVLLPADTVAGKNNLTWDGKNGAGEKVANGAYLMHLTTEGGQASKTKMIGVLR